MVEMLFPAPENATTLLEKITYINSLTDVGFGGVLGLMLMIVIFGSLFLMMKSFSFDRSMVAASLITAIFGLLFRILGWVNDYVFFISLIILVYSVYSITRESSMGEI